MCSRLHHCSHRARARGRAGPDPSRAVHDRQPAGPIMASSLRLSTSQSVDGLLQSGRRGVLTRILVGAAAAAGPHRVPGLPGPRARTLLRSMFPRDRLTCGPRPLVCLDVACPCYLCLPPFPRGTV